MLRLMCATYSVFTVRLAPFYALLNNQAFEELVSFLQGALIKAVLRVAEVRHRKQKPVKREIPTEKRLKRAIREIKQAVKEATQTESGVLEEGQRQIIEDAVQTINQVIIEHIEERTVLLEEIAMLRVLASLGLVTGEFTHEIRYMFTTLTADTNQILEIHADGLIMEIGQRLINNIRLFKTYTSFFDRAVAENAHREISPREMGQTLHAFRNIILPACNRYGIDIPEPDIKGYDLFTIPMHPSEWMSILFNLFTNSYKAIRRANRGAQEGKIMMRAWKEGKRYMSNSQIMAMEFHLRIKIASLMHFLQLLLH